MTETNPPMERKEFRAPPELMAWLATHANEWGVSFSAFVCVVLQQLCVLDRAQALTIDELLDGKIDYPDR